MIKRCLATGLFYLCKTSRQDPYGYKGSGLRWNRHIKKHNSWIITCVIGEYDTAQELSEWGIYYSKLYDIVNSPNWANLTEERGSGGLIGTGQLGKRWKIKDTSAMVEARRAFYASDKSAERAKKFSKKVSGKLNYQFKGIVVTPWGSFESLRACLTAAKELRKIDRTANVVSDEHTLKKYLANLDLPLDPSGRRTIVEWRGKTPRSIGFNFLEKDIING